MSNKEKLLVMEAQNKMNKHQGFGEIKYELTEKKVLKKMENGEVVYSISNIDNYDFISLLHDLSNDKRNEFYKYYLNKNLIPGSYNSELFVMKNKAYWENLILNIISSKTINECVKSVFHDKEKIDFSKDHVYISEIINKIRFFIYKVNIA